MRGVPTRFAARAISVASGSNGISWNPEMEEMPCALLAMAITLAGDLTLVALILVALVVVVGVDRCVIITAGMRCHRLDVCRPRETTTQG